MSNWALHVYSTAWVIDENMLMTSVTVNRYVWTLHSPRIMLPYTQYVFFFPNVDTNNVTNTGLSTTFRSCRTKKKKTPTAVIWALRTQGVITTALFCEGNMSRLIMMQRLVASPLLIPSSMTPLTKIGAMTFFFFFFCGHISNANQF